MKDFSKTDTYQVAEKMKASGNQPGVIDHWKAMVERWAMHASGPDAEAVKAWLPAWQTRALYTAAELAPLFPVLAVALGLCQRPAPQKSPLRLSHELQMTRLPRRLINGQFYFAVAHTHHWLAADDFEWEKEISNAQH